MELNEIRKDIDNIDEKLKELFGERLELSGQVAIIKAKNNDSIYKPEREAQILEWACKDVPDDQKDYYKEFFLDIMNISKDYQECIIKKEQK